ncbi:MAG TPA: hypothetical protein VMS95_01440 [Candidatus Krumholzibacteriaceae bacterium]|nr:hypothetical protein [Candidatus Krumholzibacteriaceae bacterium]
MTEKTTDRNPRRLRSFLIVGFFAFLGVSEIISIVIGAQKLDNPKTWFALAGALLILGLIALVLVGNVYTLLIAKIRGPAYRTHTLSVSPFEIKLEGFDSRYEELIKQIDGLPDTGREKDRNAQRKLREIAVALKGIKDQLTHMSGTYTYEEDLEGLERRLFDQSRLLLDVGSGIDPLWERLKKRISEFRKDLFKAEHETFKLMEFLRKDLENAKKKQKGKQ